MENIWIVIVNFRTAGLVVDCLRSLSGQISMLKNARVIVVDNNSGDDSVAVLLAAVASEGWASWVKIMPLERNGGFAYGNNAGIRSIISSAAAFDYVMLLNPDTIVLPGAIVNLLSFMDSNPQVGIAGSLLENADGSVDRSAHVFPSPLGELEGAARLGVLSRRLQRYIVSPESKHDAHACDWVSGASMLIRRQVIDSIGLMDEDFFLYYEEVDYCKRAQLSGWQCWYVPSSRVIHLEGAATGIRVAAKRRSGYWYDSRRRYFRKHHGVGGLILADGLWLAGRLSYLLRRMLRLGGSRQPDGSPRWFMFDLLWGDMRDLIARQLVFARNTGRKE